MSFNVSSRRNQNQIENEDFKRNFKRKKNSFFQSKISLNIHQNLNFWRLLYYFVFFQQKYYQLLKIMNRQRKNHFSMNLRFLRFFPRWELLEISLTFTQD